MRNLLFKNLTSGDKKRRIFLSSEIADAHGVRSIIRRHFLCAIKEINPAPVHRCGINDVRIQKPSPSLYVLKEHNDKEHREKFFYRMKASIYVTSKNRLFLVIFAHSLKIILMPAPQNSVKSA